MAPGRKTGGRKKGSKNKITPMMVLAKISGAATPVEFLLNVMQAEEVPLEQRLRAAALAAPFLHAKASDPGPKIVEVVRHVIEPGRNRALELTMRQYDGGLSDDEAAELRALNAQIVHQ